MYPVQDHNSQSDQITQQDALNYHFDDSVISFITSAVISIIKRKDILITGSTAELFREWLDSSGPGEKINLTFGTVYAAISGGKDFDLFTHLGDITLTNLLEDIFGKIYEYQGMKFIIEADTIETYLYNTKMVYIIGPWEKNSRLKIFDICLIDKKHFDLLKDPYNEFSITLIKPNMWAALLSCYNGFLSAGIRSDQIFYSKFLGRILQILQKHNFEYHEFRRVIDLGDVFPYTDIPSGHLCIALDVYQSILSQLFNIDVTSAHLPHTDSDNCWIQHQQLLEPVDVKNFSCMCPFSRYKNVFLAGKSYHINKEAFLLQNDCLHIEFNGKIYANPFLALAIGLREDQWKNKLVLVSTYLITHLKKHISKLLFHYSNNYNRQHGAQILLGSNLKMVVHKIGLNTKCKIPHRSLSNGTAVPFCIDVMLGLNN